MGPFLSLGGGGVHETLTVVRLMPIAEAFQGEAGATGRQWNSHNIMQNHKRTHTCTVHMYVHTWYVWYSKIKRQEIHSTLSQRSTSKLPVLVNDNVFCQMKVC